MNTSEVPVEFKLVARNIAIDLFDFVNSMDDLVAHSLIGIDHRPAAVLRPFLRSLLNQNLTNQALAEFWSSMPSGIYFESGETVRQFLSALLDKLEHEPYLTGSLHTV
jgi:hypothetical protein